ncbi:hypothetical protein H4Q26_001671 [Puccinia striiformis f. sp. tritici PST-130]|nr:hypothetical protein H4Q26_001671 [Puccinia striiformis f. sp. tritici PST-130]
MPSNKPKKNPKEEEDSRMLIPDVKTRWNSTYLMLKRALELGNTPFWSKEPQERQEKVLSPTRIELVT